MRLFVPPGGVAVPDQDDLAYSPFFEFCSACGTVRRKGRPCAGCVRYVRALSLYARARGETYARTTPRDAYAEAAR